MRIQHFDNVNLDLVRLQEADRYFHRYYYGQFQRHQGVEQIFAILKRHSIGGRWLDLGSGTSTLLWSIPLSGITSITCSDYYLEMLMVLWQFVQSNEVPQCYRELLTLCHREIHHLARMRQSVEAYLILDVLEPWYQHIEPETYELVTQFGCFGLAASTDRFIDCVGYAKEAVRPNGRLIGANWLRSSQFVARHGGDNSYLCNELIVRSAEMHSLQLLHNELVPISGDPDYNAVLVWAVKRP